MISYNVEDVKGNPGCRGNLFVTNLRILWQLASDHFVNVSFGWDTITSVSIKTLPVGGGNYFKHLLSVKTQNLYQNRYEFRFMGFCDEDLKIFERIAQIQKITSETKVYRMVNLATKCDPHYDTLE